MHLILAPHYDDALLSLPARLVSWVRAEQVVVAVVFSDEDPALRARCRAALHRVGAKVVELGFTEAARRGVAMRAILRPNRGKEGLPVETLGAVCSAVGALTSTAPETVAYFPLLAIHLDHAIVKAAAASAAGTVRYYEDQPYAITFPRGVAEARRACQPCGEIVCVDRPKVDALLDDVTGWISDAQLKRVRGAYDVHASHELERLWERAGSVVPA